MPVVTPAQPMGYQAPFNFSPITQFPTTNASIGPIVSTASDDAIAGKYGANTQVLLSQMMSHSTSIVDE